MEDKGVGVVKFTNLIYSFIKFQDQYKNLCQKISEEKRRNVGRCLKKVSSFYSEYKYYVRSKELRDIYSKRLDSIKEELYNDKEYLKLCLAFLLSCVYILSTENCLPNSVTALIKVSLNFYTPLLVCLTAYLV